MEIPNFNQIRNLQETKRVLNREGKIITQFEVSETARDDETIEIEPDDKRKNGHERNAMHQEKKISTKEEAFVIVKKILTYRFIETIHQFRENKTILSLLES